MVNIIFPSHKQARYIELAKRQANFSLFMHKHGAVLAKGGCVLNCAFNEVMYSSFANRFRRNRMNGIGTRHSEINVVLGLDKRLTTGADIYVVRINQDGNLKLSAPCPMCVSVAQFCGINRIIYSIDNERFGIIKL